MLIGRRRRAPLVSAIVTCFNHEAYVRATLESVAAQRYTNVELIIVDDCSTDRSVEIITTWVAGNGVEATLIAHEENRGICRSRNDALAVARGEFVCGVAGDDEWLPRKIETQVAQLSRLGSDVAVVYSDAYLMDESGSQLPGLFIERNQSFDQMPEGDIFEDLFPYNFIPPLGTLVRRRCIEEVGGYDESLVYEDWDMWLRLSRRFGFAFTPTVTARYRILPNSLIHVLHNERREEFFESTVRLLSKHLDVGPHVRAVMLHRLRELVNALDLPDRSDYLEFEAAVEALDGPASRSA